MKELKQVLAFIQEIDQLKDVQRRVKRQGGERSEDDAQHSWHIATMVVLLAPYNDEQPIDISRAVSMALFHDIPEIKTGDVWTFNDQARIGKSQREEAAMRKLVSTLPNKQAELLLALWLEYEKRETPESRFVQKVDKLQPMIQNLISGGIDWQEGPITEAMIREKKDHHYNPGTFLHKLYNHVITLGKSRGILRES